MERLRTVAVAHGTHQYNMRANTSFVRLRVSSAVRLWLLIRAVGMLILALGGLNPFRLSAMASLGIVLLCAVLGQIDEILHHEAVLLDNFGIPRIQRIVLDLVPAVVAEAALFLAIRAVR